MDVSGIDYFQQIQQMSKMIYDYGIMVVISAIFIVLAVVIMILGLRRWTSKNKKKAEDNQTLLGSILKQNQELIASITKTSQTIQQATDKEKESSKDVVVQSFLNHKISDAMSLTREMVKADRIDCYLFANGTSSLSGTYRFFRFVRTFSAIRKGSKADALAEMPLSFLPRVFSRLAEEKEFAVWDIDSLPEESSVAQTWLETTGARAAIFSLIKETDSPTGFIVALYEEPYDSEETRKEVETRVNNLAIKVGVLIDSNLKEG